MKLELTEQEASALFAAIDAGVKALGIQAVLPLAPILTKLQQAAAEAAADATKEAE